MNTLQYFLQAFPEPEAKLLVHTTGHPNGTDKYSDTLATMPIDSNCGDDCKRAIDSCKAFSNDIEMAFGRNDYGVYSSNLENLFRVLSCFICG